MGKGSSGKAASKNGNIYTFGNRSFKIDNWENVGQIPGEAVLGSHEAVQDFYIEYGKHVNLSEEAGRLKVYRENEFPSRIHDGYNRIQISTGYHTDIADYPVTGDAERDSKARQAARVMLLNWRAKKGAR